MCEGEPYKATPSLSLPLSPLHITLRDVQVKVGTIYHWGRKKGTIYVCVWSVWNPCFFWQMAYSVCLWRAVWVTGKWQAGPRSKRELYWALALLFLTPPAHIYHFLKRKWDSYNIMWYVGGFYILTAQLNTLMHINGHTRCHIEKQFCVKFLHFQRQFFNDDFDAFLQKWIIQPLHAKNSKNGCHCSNLRDFNTSFIKPFYAKNRKKGCHCFILRDFNTSPLTVYVFDLTKPPLLHLHFYWIILVSFNEICMLDT